MATMDEDPAAYWSDDAGPKWVRAQAALDEMMTPFTAHLLEVTGVRPGQRVIDIGCGCGTTSLAFADVAGPSGGVLGVDVSEPMVERARTRGGDRPQLRFQLADAATCTFEPGWAHLVTSRFGVMFFPEPARAFANIRGSLRPDGRLACMVWQPPQRNPWIGYIMQAFPEIDMPLPQPDDGPGPFALSDPDQVRAILGAAGFSSVTLEPFATKLAWADTVDQAMELLVEVGPLSRVLSEADEPQRAKLAERARDFLAERYADGPPRLDAAVWMLNATP